MCCHIKFEKKRCKWAQNVLPIYQRYHDEEWGRVVHDDTKLFEMLVLEGAQAGLSWLTILKRREAYREAFDGFDIAKVANFGAEKQKELINNQQIIRNRLKIAAAVKNAQIVLKIQKEFGSLDKYIWHFTNSKTMRFDVFPLPAKNGLSDIVSKDMKKRGMKFVGSTIIYSYLQAIGVIDDHEPDCFLYHN